MKTYMVHLDNALRKEEVIKYSDHLEVIKELERKLGEAEGIAKHLWTMAGIKGGDPSRLKL